MNKKLSSHEKTELIYKQILADEENEKAKKIKRLRDLRLSQASSGNSNEQKIHTNYCSNFCTPIHKRILKTVRWTNILMGTQSSSAMDCIRPIML